MIRYLRYFHHRYKWKRCIITLQRVVGGVLDVYRLRVMYKQLMTYLFCLAKVLTLSVKHLRVLSLLRSK